MEGSMVLSLLGIGKLNYEEGRYRDAKVSYLEAEKLATKLGLLPQLKQTYKELADLNAEEGNYKKSNEYLNALILIKDSIYNEQRSEQINRLEAQYQLKEKDIQINQQETELGLKDSQLEKQRILNIGIGIISVLFLIIVILVWLNLGRRKRINRELKNLDMAKSRFFTNISHEMRNPLTLIMSPLQKISEESENTPLYNDLQLAYTNSKKLLDRVNEILDLSKLESGKMELHQTTVNLHNICHRIFYTYESLAHYRNIKLNFRCVTDKDIHVFLDVE
jgi:signal transduction histidine kinase